MLPDAKETCGSRNAELLALFEVSQALSASFDLQVNLTAAMQALAAHLDMRRGTVTLVDPETGELNIAVAHGLTVDEIARGTYRVGEGVVGRVVESGRPIVVRDIESDPVFLNRTGARFDRSNVSFVCVPIALGREVLGVLSADRVFADGTSFAEDVRVLSIVAAAIAHAVMLWRQYTREAEERARLSAELKGRLSFPSIVGDSDAMQEVFKVVRKVATSRATVLLRGESGTGKELIARSIHQNSPRSKAPFIAINCAALPENLLEAELFGYEKGAFTGATAAKKGRFELADTGTIFLDEIGELSQPMQAKLLRVLQEHTFERLGGVKTIRVDARIISATNRDLELMTGQGTFREDLYWRLNVVPVFLPALRERPEDIPVLVDHFVRRFGRENRRHVRFDRDALKELATYPWPGNIRELENTVERLVVLADGHVIARTDLPTHILRDGSDPSAPSTLPGEVEAMERSRIRRALEEHHGVQARAAHDLGLTPRQLAYRLKKYHLDG
ncbi:MAG: sigma-54-dependent Fis family transcriptional regulator [Coriobacteriia bacterium]